MEQTLNHGMCRCCASEGMFKNFSATYQWMGADEVYADMLKECFDISLTTADDWNNGGICEVCITQLRNASNFRKQVLQTEDQFKKALQDKLYKDSIVKVEVNRDEDDLDSDNNVSDFSGTEFEVPVKEELEETKTKKRTAKATTSRAKKAKTEDGEPSSKRIRHETKEDALEHYKLRVKTEVDLDMVFKDLNEPGDHVDEKYQDVSDTSPKVKRVVGKKTVIKFIKELDKHRNNIKEVLLWSNATVIRSHSDIGYSCFFCKEQYLEPADLKSHNLKDHFRDITTARFKKERDLKTFSMKVDITGLQCKICHESIESLENLFDHLSNVHNRNIFTDVKNHIIPFKFDSEILRCAICSLEISTFKCLFEHMHKHFRNFVCNICDTGFINRRGLNSHLDRHNTGVYSCEYCEKIFDTSRKKVAHERGVHVHSNLRNKCGYCNEKFTNLRKKELHLETVHGAKTVAVKCQACDRTLANRDALRIHIKRHHLMEKKHECPDCDMKFFSNSSLVTHMVKHSKIRAFECDVCFKRYGRKKTLREHLRIHANDRRYKCEFCGMTFVQKCSLTVHSRTKHPEEMD